VEELYRAGVDVYTIQRLLSLGFLGRRLRRRLVPTRWSITAVDDIISRALRRELRGKPEVQDVRVYYNEYLGNRFLVVVKPGPGGFEWIEVWQPRSIWVKEAAEPIVWRVEENALGEATAVDGGFSAARLAVLEALAREGRRADVVIVREITPEYYAPLGNWHVRETVRRAMGLKPLAVNPTLGELKSVLGERMEYSPENILSKAKLLAEKRKLTDYI